MKLKDAKLKGILINAFLLLLGLSGIALMVYGIILLNS